MPLLLTALLFFCFSSTIFADDTLLKVGDFSSGKLDKWNIKTFSGKTDYQLVTFDKVSVLRAESHASASGLFKEQRINLQKTPFLNWRWRIDNRLKDLNEYNKQGDDYSARVYIIVNGGWQFWRTKAINYVWASHLPKESVWPNAFAGKSAMMIALRSSNDNTHTWYTEKRNIKDDLKAQFGADINFIDAVALMTDTDNAKGHAISYYGDIFFSQD